MPFHVARNFKAAEIQREVPTSSGVYGLSNAREWIYVGETDDMQARLLEHLEKSDAFGADGVPTGFSFELCLPHERVARQRRFIQELGPARNGRMRRRPESAHRGGSKPAREDC